MSTWESKLDAFAQEEPVLANTARAVITEAMKHGLEAPVVFTTPSSDAPVDIVWQYGRSRVTVFVEEDGIEALIVPEGTEEVFTASSPEAAAAYVAGVLHGMAAV